MTLYIKRQSTMTVGVYVEQKHIDHGIIGNCTDCPVALALTDAFKCLNIDVIETLVSASGITVITAPIDHPALPRESAGKRLAFRSSTPYAFGDFIHRFDDSERVEPVSGLIHFTVSEY